MILLVTSAMVEDLADGWGISRKRGLRPSFRRFLITLFPKKFFCLCLNQDFEDS